MNLSSGLKPRLAAPAGRDAKLIVSKGCSNLLVAGMGGAPRASAASREASPFLEGLHTALAMSAN